MFVYPQWEVRGADLRWWLPACAAVATTAILFWRRDRTVVRGLLLAWLLFCLAAPGHGPYRRTTCAIRSWPITTIRGDPSRRASPRGRGARDTRARAGCGSSVSCPRRTQGRIERPRIQPSMGRSSVEHRAAHGPWPRNPPGEPTVRECRDSVSDDVDEEPIVMADAQPSGCAPRRHIDW
jgi:hypothetical protein